ncbi:MAG: glycoside hydrolase family 15 protein [Coleofasciculaceae cyanobacterium]
MKSIQNLQDIQNISTFLHNQGTFEFPTLPTGLFPAATVQDKAEYTGYQSIWVRDNIHIAHAHYVLGQTNIAIKNITSLLTYFQKHQWRFQTIIEGKANPQEVMNRPHVRFDGNNLEEIKQKWAQAQNDALGYFLWFYCKLVNEGILTTQPEHLELIALLPLYFQAISYWQDEDSGHWEEVRKVEASSLGVVVAGLKELKQLLSKTSLASACKYKDKIITNPLLDKLIEQGNTALKTILPAECIQNEPTKNRRYDAALLFLIYPLQIVEEEIANQILDDVINNLQGERGISRYLGDSYWCADYKAKLAPEERTIDFSDNMSWRDTLLKEGEEAQWCIFDPIISAIFGLKFQKTRQNKYLEQQIHYLNRSLSQLTGENSEFGKYKCPELYYLEKGHYLPSDATPLLWTQANLLIALKMAEYSLL